MKTMVRPSFLAFFLTPASALASTAEPFLRSAPKHVPSVADNSSRAGAKSAMPGKGDTLPRIRVQSDGPHATRSTDWSHNRVPRARASDRARFAAGPLVVSAAFV